MRMLPALIAVLGILMADASLAQDAGKADDAEEVGEVRGFWLGRSKRFVGAISYRPDLTTFRVDFDLPDEPLGCKGEFAMRDEEAGSWKFTCSDGTVSKGTVQRDPRTGVIEFFGYDVAGNRLAFRIVPESAQVPVAVPSRSYFEEKPGTYERPESFDSETEAPGGPKGGGTSPQSGLPEPNRRGKLGAPSPVVSGADAARASRGASSFDASGPSSGGRSAEAASRSQTPVSRVGRVPRGAGASGSLSGRARGVGR